MRVAPPSLIASQAVVGGVVGEWVVAAAGRRQARRIKVPKAGPDVCESTGSMGDLSARREEGVAATLCRKLGAVLFLRQMEISSG